MSPYGLHYDVKVAIIAYKLEGFVVRNTILKVDLPHGGFVRENDVEGSKKRALMDMLGEMNMTIKQFKFKLPERQYYIKKCLRSSLVVDYF